MIDKVEAFCVGAAGFMVVAFVAILLFGLFHFAYNGGYEDGFQCASYQVHCR